MIRGVLFEIPQETNNYLWQVLKCINIKKYKWYNIDSQSEVWDNPYGKLFFDKDFYIGKDFFNKIKLNQYIVFLKLQAYFEKGKIYNIHTFKEYEESDCQLLLLIYDCSYVNIYIKDSTVSKKIYENALYENFEKVEYITDKNDSRTKMDIL